MKHSLPDLSTPVGIENFIKKLQKTARSFNRTDSEKYERICYLVECMEYQFITLPRQRIELNMQLFKDKEEARTEMEAKVKAKYYTKLTPKTLQDEDHDAMYSEIVGFGEYFVNS